MQDSKLLIVNGKWFKHGFSTLILVVIVAVIGIIAIYVYGVKTGQTDKVPVYLPGKEQDQQVEDLGQVSNSDEIEVVENELNSTNFESLDEGMNEADKELADL